MAGLVSHQHRHRHLPVLLVLLVPLQHRASNNISPRKCNCQFAQSFDTGALA
jgi:hypothetical protein